MPITTTDLMSKLKRRLGVSHMSLPVSDKEILDCIYEDSVKTFSSFFPNYFTTKINVDRDLVPGTKNTYFIRDSEVFGDEIDILGVVEVKSTTTMVDMSPYPLTIQQMVGSQLLRDIDSFAQLPITFEFLSPDKIKIDCEMYFVNEFYVELMLTHPKNLNTIPMGFYETFYRLCELDVKIFLYQILKHYDKIDTTFGQIDLKIDDWSDAMDRRETLIEDWRQKFINNAKRKIFSA